VAGVVRKIACPSGKVEGSLSVPTSMADYILAFRMLKHWFNIVLSLRDKSHSPIEAARIIPGPLGRKLPDTDFVQMTELHHRALTLLPS
jgi:hypothetical protein